MDELKEITLADLSHSKWTDEDWERNANLKFVSGERCIVPARHPDNDDTWAVAIYEPTSWGDGHKLEYLVQSLKAKTWEEAEDFCSRIYVSGDFVRMRPKTDPTGGAGSGQDSGSP